MPRLRLRPQNRLFSLDIPLRDIDDTIAKSGSDFLEGFAFCFAGINQQEHSIYIHWSLAGLAAHGK